eukprot:5559682-Prymnesium_polylepis.1
MAVVMRAAQVAGGEVQAVVSEVLGASTAAGMGEGKVARVVEVVAKGSSRAEGRVVVMAEAMVAAVTVATEAMAAEKTVVDRVAVWAAVATAVGMAVAMVVGVMAGVLAATMERVVGMAAQATAEAMANRVAKLEALAVVAERAAGFSAWAAEKEELAASKEVGRAAVTAVAL